MLCAELALTLELGIFLVLWSSWLLSLVGMERCGAGALAAAAAAAVAAAAGAPSSPRDHRCPAANNTPASMPAPLLPARLPKLRGRVLTPRWELRRCIAVLLRCRGLRLGPTPIRRGRVGAQGRHPGASKGCRPPAAQLVRCERPTTLQLGTQARGQAMITGLQLRRALPRQTHAGARRNINRHRACSQPTIHSSHQNKLVGKDTGDSTKRAQRRPPAAMRCGGRHDKNVQHAPLHWARSRSCLYRSAAGLCRDCCSQGGRTGGGRVAAWQHSSRGSGGTVHFMARNRSPAHTATSTPAPPAAPVCRTTAAPAAPRLARRAGAAGPAPHRHTAA